MLQSLLLYSSKRQIPLTHDNAAQLLVPFFAAVFALVWFGIYLKKRRVAKLKPVAEHYGGTVRERFTGEMILTGTYRGMPFIFRFCENCKYPSLQLRAEARSYVDLQITRETPLTELAQGAGFLLDPQTGDPRFDGKFHLKAKDRDAALKFLSDSGTRDRIAVLMDMGYHTLTVFKDGETITGMLKLEKKDFLTDEELSQQHLEYLLENLKALSEKTAPPGKSFN